MPCPGDGRNVCFDKLLGALQSAKANDFVKLLMKFKITASVHATTLTLPRHYRDPQSLQELRGKMLFFFALHGL